jgi:hypothetical protein
MKKLFSIIVIFSALIFCNAQEIDIQKVDFTAVNVLNHIDKFDSSEIEKKFNLAFSAILPAGGIYLLTDNITGKEAVVQIGYSIINQSPFVLYLPDYIYKYFSSTYDKKVDKVSLKVKFLGWNKPDEEAQALDLQSLIVEPDQSLSEIQKNGKDKVYIQLGSYSYQQNAFPAITEMMPYLEMRPHFYLIKKDIKQNEEDKSIYRILAGPYSSKDAKRIVSLLNKTKNKSVFIHNIDTIFKEEKAGSKK